MNTTKYREDTPGCKNKIFFNSAGSSLMPTSAFNVIIDYLQNENILGGYEMAKLKDREIFEFYEQVAILLNCNPQNIAFTNSATDAYSKALSSIIFNTNDTILTTTDDYVSNQLAFLSLKKRFGINIVHAKKLANNDIDLQDFENKILINRPKLIAVTHIPTNTGLIQDVEKIGNLCQKYKIIYLVDACQSVGQIVVDVQKIKCDFLTATGRKFLRGPRGTGFLYVSNKVIQSNIEPLFLDLQGATWITKDTYHIEPNAKRFESWEMPIAAIMGFAAALKYLNDIGIENIQKYNQKISAYFRIKLAELSNIYTLDHGTNLSNIISIHPKNSSLKEIEDLLKSNSICYSVVTKFNAFLDFEHKNVEWAIRFSPHYFNTVLEIDTVINVLKQI